MSGDETPPSPASSAETETVAAVRHPSASPEEQCRFHPGDILASRFQIVRYLAKGGMGEVYEARDRLLRGHSVALKTILSNAVLTGAGRTLLEKEVILARQVTHPNVCPTYDLFQAPESEGGTYFLTMKLLRGESLAKRLQRLQGPLPVDEGFSVARQVAAALHAAHRARVIHRDLKPGNVMLEGVGTEVTAIVTDFGLALSVTTEETLTKTSFIGGTPGYIAPEVSLGHPATPASDIYAFGVLLHEIFSGRRPPAEGVKRESLITLDRKRNRVCSQLIEGCLSSLPDVRMRTFESAVHSWESGLQPLTFSFPELSKTRRHWLKLALTAGAATASVIGWRENIWEDLAHPLPRKRFVALLKFPPIADDRVRPLVSGAIDAIETSLSRAEAADRDLFVIAAPNTPHTTEASELALARDALGANIALALFGSLDHQRLHLLFRVIDVSSGVILRVKHLVSTSKNINDIPLLAVDAAAQLLNVRLLRNGVPPVTGGTKSPEAYTAFQSAQSLLQESNDAGLEKAIESYKSALELDPTYGLAYAQLAIAYCRLHAIDGNPAALDMARRNAEAALRLDSRLLAAHLALSSVYNLNGRK